MQGIKMNIEGLEENETQDRLRSQLEGIVGVKDVYLSKGQDYVVINYDDQTSSEEINSHLQNNGYKVNDIIPVTGY